MAAYTINTGEKEMNTSIAKCTRPGQSPKYIPSAVNFKGYLVCKTQKGVGTPTENGAMNAYGEGETWEEYDTYIDFLKPYFNQDLVVKFFNKEEFKKKYDNLEIREIIGTEAEKALIKWGENEGGLIVEDADQAKKKEKVIAAKQQQEKILTEFGFLFEIEKVTKTFDEDGEIPCFHYRITHQETGRIFKFIDRNLFDVGRIINPACGGILIDVEEFIKNNPFTFSGLNHNDYHVQDNNPDFDPSKSEKANEYRAEHPSETGCGYERSFIAEDSEDKREWIPVDQIELSAYKIVQQYGSAMRGIRV